MPEKCKELFIRSMKEDYDGIDEYTQEEQDFIHTPHQLTDFKTGLVVPGKLLPKRIRGGIVLVDTSYEIR